MYKASTYKVSLGNGWIYIETGNINHELFYRTRHANENYNQSFIYPSDTSMSNVSVALVNEDEGYGSYPSASATLIPTSHALVFILSSLNCKHRR